jgi:hypothetical protein
MKGMGHCEDHLIGSTKNLTLAFGEQVFSYLPEASRQGDNYVSECACVCV